MANKTENLINFKKYEDFKAAVEAGEIKNDSIVFIDDKQKIYTHGVEFDGSISSEPITDLTEILD